MSSKESTDTGTKDSAIDYKEIAQRVQAEFENYKKRVDKEKQDSKEIVKIEVIKKMLPLMDSFEQALLAHPKAENESKETTSIRKGMELLYSQLYSALKSEGVKKIDCLGKKFDPYSHEVLMQVESEKDDGTIVQEYQAGYMIKDFVLRHSKVNVSKGGKNVEVDKSTNIFPVEKNANND